MKINNLTKGTVIATDLQRLDSLWGMIWGLLNKNNSRSLYFKTRFGIHTLGLKVPIDIIILDEKFRVIKLGTIPPNRLFFWNPLYNNVIELKQGIIKNSQIKLNDLLSITT